MLIKCPYCLKETTASLEVKGNNTLYLCGDCKATIHRDYIEKNAYKNRIGLVGFTGHGKTVYLTALFYLLKYLGRVGIWGDFTWQTLDNNTHEIMFNHVKKFEMESKLPDSTPENFPHPALIKFEDIPLFSRQFLSFYDTAGRVFKETDKITDMGRFVAYSDVVFFIISIKDCGNSVADSMEEFLNIYLDAVHNRLRVALKESQHLIIVLTKADDIQLPQNLSDFLNSGSYRWYTKRIKKHVKKNKGLAKEREKQQKLHKFGRKKL